MGKLDNVIVFDNKHTFNNVTASWIICSTGSIDSTGQMGTLWQLDGVTIQQTANVIAANIIVEHAWELNGVYSTLTYPQINIDSIFFAHSFPCAPIWSLQNLSQANRNFYFTS